VCSHDGKDGQDYYFRLQVAVERDFVTNPCMGIKDLFEILDGLPDPPAGCKPLPNPSGWYDDDDSDAFGCPLRPMVIRKNLSEIVSKLRQNEVKLLDQLFGDTPGSG